MEEIYKPDNKEADKVELYSRENNDILGDVPNWLIHTGSYIIYGLIGLLIIFAAVFSYPDTVKTGIVIDDLSKTAWITAGHSGIIDRFLVDDREKVEHNDTLCILRNAASIEDVKEFCRVLGNVEAYYRTNDIKYLNRFPFNLIMGDMTGAYGQFTSAVRTCMIYDEFDIFSHKENFLKEELELLNRHPEKNEMDILNTRRRLFDLRMEHRKEVALNRRTLELAYEGMINSLKMWEAKYLIKSSGNGNVILGKSWSISNVINMGDTLCSVISEQKGQPMGRIKLSHEDVAEIAAGDKVNIELKKYPVHTYGYLTGEVASITYVPFSKNYAVEISFPYGLNTTTKDEIAYEIGLAGKAEIITANRSILNRIFSPLYQIFKRSDKNNLSSNLQNNDYYDKQEL